MNPTNRTTRDKGDNRTVNRDTVLRLSGALPSVGVEFDNVVVQREFRTIDTFRRVLDEHRCLLWMTLAYLFGGGTVLAILERPWPLQLLNLWLTVAWLSASIPWLLWQWIRHPKRFAAALEPTRILGAIFVLALALPIQITFQSLKQGIGPVFGFSWDPWLSQVDRVLHGGDAWRLFAPIVESPTALSAIDTAYKAWFLVLVLFLCWGCWSKRRALRQRSLLAFLLLWIIGGTMAAWLFASAGPCYYERVAHGDRVYAELMTALDTNSSLWARLSQEGLWRSHVEDVWRHFGGISAFPSMHVGFAALVAIVAWRAHRGLGALLWLFAAVTQVGSVVLGWHYAIDGYAGALIAWGSWRLAGRFSGTGDDQQTVDSINRGCADPEHSAQEVALASNPSSVCHSEIRRAEWVSPR